MIHTEKFKKHIIFPLCALSMNIAFKRKLMYLIHYSIFQIGKMDMNDERTLDKIHNTNPYTTINDYDENDIRVFADSAAHARNIEIENIDRAKLNHEVVKIHNRKFTAQYGQDARVLIKVDLIMDIIENNVMDEKHFSVLCAIYSCLGRNKYRIIINDQIRYRALGYKNKISGVDEKLLLKDKKLKNIIDNLIKRKFFQRAYDKRKYYYSKVLSQEKLEKLVEYILKMRMIERHSGKIKQKRLSIVKKSFQKRLENCKYDELKKMKEDFLNKKLEITNSKKN